MYLYELSQPIPPNSALEKKNLLYTWILNCSKIKVIWKPGEILVPGFPLNHIISEYTIERRKKTGKQKKKNNFERHETHK